MFVLERRIALLFRTALRLCLDGPAKRTDLIPVLLRHGKSGLLMHARQEEFAVMYSQPGPTEKGVLAFPASTLAIIEGRTQDPVELTSAGFGKAMAGWHEKGVPRSIEIPTLEPERVPDPPALPKSFDPVDERFLAALHEASKSASREPTRYAINRIMLRGKTGEVIGTDAKQLLIQSGFTFPFKEDVLIPRSGVFGHQGFQGLEGTAFGRTDTHVCIRTGRWLFCFTIDAKARYPDATSIIPRQSAATTRFRLDPADAEFFLSSLSKRLRGPGSKDLPITLDLGEEPCFRFRLDDKVLELPLPRSQVSGKEVRLCLDLQQFLRALELQFQEFEVREPEKPLVARDGSRVFLMMPLPPSSALPPQAGVVSLSATARPVPRATVQEAQPIPVALPVPQPLVRVEPAPAKETLVVTAAGSQLPALESEPFDVFGEAEGLTTSVMRAAQHAGQLLRFLKGVCAQPQVVQVFRSSLQALLDKSPGSPLEKPSS